MVAAIKLRVYINIIYWGITIMYKPLVVRLVRKGDKLYRVYRIVVTSLDPVRKGGEIACIGFINPRTGEWQIVVDSERLAMWVNRGAQVGANAAKYIGMVTLYPTHIS